MNKLFIGLMLAFTVSSGTVLGGWWDGNKDEGDGKEEPVVPTKVIDIPFDVPYLEPYVIEDNYCDCDCVIKRAKYVMEMKPTKGPWGDSMKTRDPHLNLKIKINMKGQIWEKPVECIVTQGNDLYVSNSIWACRVSDSKLVYIVSFKQTNSFLVIYKPKKSRWKAQWAFLDRNNN